MNTHAVMVLGCKVNDYEASYLKRKMSQKYQEVSFRDKADIYVIFTCCVTNMAEAKTRKMLHRARKNNPHAFIVAIGCLSQIKGDTDDFRDIDLVIGSSQKDRAFELIDSHMRANVVEDLKNASFEKLYFDRYPDKERAFLKIQDGCNQFCAYCMIPYSRGPERSGDHNDLLKQAELLSETSREVVLTGIHTGRYNDGSYDLYRLLKELVKIEGLETIRLSSIEITEISDEIISLMKDNEKIAHHLHIPLQAGTDEILKAMNRPYTLEEYIDRVEYIRRQIPDISISTDLICGFPGESEELFEKTLRTIERIRFSFIHCFPYARKKGTVADGMSGHLNNDVKKERVNRVLSFQKGITEEFNRSFIGKKLRLLVEKKDEDYVYGYVRQYFYVKAKGDAQIGDLCDVIITAVNEEGVEGYVA